MSEEYCKAIAAKHVALKSTKKAHALAAARLEKWHAERNARRDAQDEVARQEKVIREMNVVTERYRTEAEQLQARKREMRRE